MYVLGFSRISNKISQKELNFLIGFPNPNSFRFKVMKRIDPPLFQTSPLQNSIALY